MGDLSVDNEGDATIKEGLETYFMNLLLRPKEWTPPSDNSFPFKIEFINILIDEAEKIIKEQPMVLKIRAPVKIFGDIHGQQIDLMRFFDLQGAPNEEGDIESFDQLFLGDYVDRGTHSLETVCLLFALKIKYKDQIHLLRGNHEDRWINQIFGFADECRIRLGEDPNEPNSIFNKINRLFEQLPMAALIENKMLCLHGGIGSRVNNVADIENLPRPLEVVHEVINDTQQLIVDILWSDPTDNDNELGIQANTVRDPNGSGNIVKYGPDRVKDFLKHNGQTQIIRAHECVMDGFERFAGGHLITVFSATDQCGRHKNAGAILVLKKNFEFQPKLIQPQNNPHNQWMEDDETLRKRPPTPPRWRDAGPRRGNSGQN